MTKIIKVLTGFVVFVLIGSAPTVLLAENQELSDLQEYGVIDRIANNEIVIDDSLYTIPSGALCYSEVELLMNCGSFTVGDNVAFKLQPGETGKIAILKKHNPEAVTE